MPLDAVGVSGIVFAVGFALGGTLALVHSWGRVWPRWVVPLAGRRVPCWLVLGPATVISIGMIAYFGVGMLNGIGRLLQGTNLSAEGGSVYPEVFFWVTIPAYVMWGAGMAVAAVAYHRRTVTAPASPAPVTRSPASPALRRAAV